MDIQDVCSLQPVDGCAQGVGAEFAQRLGMQCLSGAAQHECISVSLLGGAGLEVLCCCSTFFVQGSCGALAVLSTV